MRRTPANKTSKQLEALKKYCKKVIIDLDKGPDLPDRNELLTSRTGEGARPKLAEPLGPSVLTTIKHKVTYKEKATVDEELPVARSVPERLSDRTNAASCHVRRGPLARPKSGIRPGMPVARIATSPASSAARTNVGRSSDGP